MTQPKPEFCGGCKHGYHPSVDPNATICYLIGMDAIYDSDKLNPDCPLIDKPIKGPTKKEMAKEIAQLRQDKTELVKALEEIKNLRGTTIAKWGEYDKTKLFNRAEKIAKGAIAKATK